jgi:hypothetical protein
MGRQYSGRPSHVSPMFSNKYRGDEEEKGEEEKRPKEKRRTE